MLNSIYLNSLVLHPILLEGGFSEISLTTSNLRWYKFSASFVVIKLHFSFYKSTNFTELSVYSSIGVGFTLPLALYARFIQLRILSKFLLTMFMKFLLEPNAIKSARWDIGLSSSAFLVIL